MSDIALRRTDGTQKKPLFKIILEDVPGGITLKTSELKSGTEDIEAGALLSEDPTTAGLFHLVKTAQVYEELAAAGTSLKVKKAHQFKVGEFITSGQVSTAIVSITTTETDYDTIVLTAAFDSKEAVPVDTILYQGDSETSNAATPGTALVEDEADDTLTVSNTRGDANGVKIVIEQAGDDNLAVAYVLPTKILTIF